MAPRVSAEGAGFWRVVLFICRLDKNAHVMLAPSIDERSDCATAEHVEATAEQGKTLIRKVAHRRREVHFAVKPRLDGVLIGRSHIGQVAGLERAQVGVDDFRGKG